MPPAAPQILLDANDPIGPVIKISGDWHIQAKIINADDFMAEAKKQEEFLKNKSLRFNTTGLESWDSSLVVLLQLLYDWTLESNIAVDKSTLPKPLNELIALASAVPEMKDAVRHEKHASLLARLGQASISIGEELWQTLGFVGEVAQAFTRMVARGKVTFRARDFWLVLQQGGVEALPIITLISFLVGMTMAFVGAIQLANFGATIYIANLVALAMVREMGAMMVGILLCGRTGAAYASQLGSMKVSEELDAFQTLGISPIDFLVIPRVIALSLMTPLLCIYANFIGMAGGMFVAVSMMHITVTQYIHQTQISLSLTDFSTGIIKSVVFGVLVVITGCLRGMQCGSSSSAVGEAATSAVVLGITSIVVADSIFAVIFHVLNI